MKNLTSLRSARKAKGIETTGGGTSAEQKLTTSSRIIGKAEGRSAGPVLVLTAGLHGNEPSGVVALNEVLTHPVFKSGEFKGVVIGLRGNLAALKKGVRYVEEDLNRLWTPDRMSKRTHDRLEQAHELNADEMELHALHEEIEKITKQYKGPFYFIDLHSVSAPTIPFIALSDTLINRKLAGKFPVPSVLGIEEHVHGAFQDYINEMGYVGFAFEAGQHDDIESIDRHVSFTWLALVYTGLLTKSQVPGYNFHYQTLKEAAGHENKFFEIRHRQGIQPRQLFKMRPGFVNFQRIRKNESLATDREGDIRAKESGRIFMPLYQSQGDDGFFLIRAVSVIWLQLSALLRKIRFEALLIMLPGVRRHPGKKHVIDVDTRISKFLVNDLFHLLGFKRVAHHGTHLEFKRREFDIRPKRK